MPAAGATVNLRCVVTLKSPVPGLSRLSLTTTSLLGFTVLFTRPGHGKL